MFQGTSLEYYPPTGYVPPKHEHYHKIQHIGIGLGTNFHYYQASLIFCQKNCQERVFSGQSKSNEYYHGILKIRQHT